MNASLAPELDWMQLLVMTIGLFVVYEIAFRLGRRYEDDSEKSRRSQADLVVAALLTLLGLLLAFTFELGAARYDKRKDLVLEEANAIGTTYRRAEVLPAPYADHVRGLLRDYVELRANLSTPEELNEVLRTSSTLQANLWTEAMGAVRAKDTPSVALFVDSLNQLIDSQKARVTVVLYQRLPTAIYEVLYFVALVSVAMIGARSGFARSRTLTSTAVLVAVIIAVIGLIVSLDAPVSRLFRISQYAIADTREEMLHVPPATTARP